MDVISGETIYISARYALRSQLYAFYDKDKKVISVYPNTEDSEDTLVTRLEVIVPERAAYIVISSCYTNNTKDLILERKKDIKNNALLLKILNGANKDFNNPTWTQNISLINDSLPKSNIDIISDNKFIHYNSGELINHNDNCFYTDFIDIDDISDTIILKSYAIANSCSMAFYGINKDFLGSDKKSYVFEQISWLDILNNYPQCKYIRFCSINKNQLEIYEIENKENYFYTIPKYIDLQKETEHKIRRDFKDINILKGYYIYYQNGSFVSDSDSFYTNKIQINTLPNILYYSGSSQYNTCIYALYANSVYIGALYNQDDTSTPNIQTNLKITISDIKNQYPTVTEIAFCSYQKEMKFQMDDNVSLDDLYNMIENNNNNDSIDNLSNILYGKKYVACGDSFTEGDFSSFVDEDGKSGKDSPYLYDSDWKMYKTYPYWIAKRNNMTLINEAKCGSTLPLSKEYTDGEQPENYKNPFSLNRYKEVPKDADYITLMFGLNEGKIPIGELTDTDNTTILGAYNKVLEYFLTEIPYAKIGIIVSDSWLSQSLHDAIIKAAQYWGIPYLDLKGDDSVPLQMGGRLNNITLNQTAKTLRDNAYRVSSSNGHPNIESHKQRSTIIENFLRSL